MINISNCKIVKDIIKDVLFLGKSIDELEGLIENFGLNEKNIIAVRSSEKLHKKYNKIYVYEYITKRREISTSSFFQNKFFTENIFDWFIRERNRKNNLWLYRSYEWCKDLEMTSLVSKVLAIEYDLYVKLTNKILLKNILIKNCNLNLANFFTRNNNNLKTKYVFNTKSSIYKILNDVDFPIVITSQHSDGGEGVFKVSNIEEFHRVISYIKNPVIKVDKFIEGKSYNQIGVIFSDAIVVYQPSKQIIEKNELKLKYMGSTFKIDISEEIIKELTNYTYQIGEVLQKMGYKGMYGIDYLIDNKNNIYFIELNPRFQASSFLLTYNKQLNPYIAHILSFFISLKKLLQECNINKFDKFIFINNLNMKYYTFKYIKSKEEIESNKEIRIPPPYITIEEGAPIGFYLEK